jgi:hypothetical protein
MRTCSALPTTDRRELHPAVMTAFEQAAVLAS